MRLIKINAEIINIDMVVSVRNIPGAAAFVIKYLEGNELVISRNLGQYEYEVYSSASQELLPYIKDWFCWPEEKFDRVKIGMPKDILLEYEAWRNYHFDVYKKELWQMAQNDIDSMFNQFLNIWKIKESLDPIPEIKP